MAKEIAFIKYQKRGAYHWPQYFGHIFKIDCFLRGRYQLLVRLLKNYNISSESHLLEIGSGDGALSGLIYKTLGCMIEGVEPSAEGVRFSEEMFTKHQFKGRFKVAEGYSFDFADQQFDAIVLADVIEHIQYPDLMLQEIKRLLKPGGIVLITTPIRTSEYPEDKMHVQEFYPHQLINLCRPYFGNPQEIIYSHPVVWYELYTFGNKINRSIFRFYCRFLDKIFGKNPFLKTAKNSNWKNFKQQALVLKKID